MKHLKILLLAAVVMVAFISCTDEFESTFMPEKPEDVAVLEHLNSFDALKTYIDRSENTNFKLGVGLTVSDFLKKESMYSLTRYNFDEINAINEMQYGSIVKDDGSMDFSAVMGFINAAKDAEIAIYGHSLVWHANQNPKYLNPLIDPIIIPAPPAQSGTTIIADFESEVLGTTYPMTAGGSGTVVTDPQGTGKVLRVVGAQTHPVFTVTLPAGVTLGNCKEVVLDMLFGKGIFGQGMRMSLNGGPLVGAGYLQPYAYGVREGVWSRGLVIMPVANMNLTEAQKALTTFTLAIGSATGDADYHIDNVKISWETGGESSGRVTMSDFESDALGTTYPMTAGGSGTVVTDPQGTGKVLRVVGIQTHPTFNVTLPAGITLGNCTEVVLDMLFGKGIFGQGMRLSLNGGPLVGTGYLQPYAYGVREGVWSRGLVKLPIANMGLTEAQKALTTFTLSVGSATGDADYHIDNVVIEWKITGDLIVHKTPEEKKQIYTEKMDKWIEGMMGVAKEYVKAWTVVNEPMDDANPTELKTGVGQTLPAGIFYWQDYLGEDYAVEAFKLAALHGNSDDKLFINDNNLESNIDKCEGLIAYVEYIESQGARVDGIGTQMHISTVSDKEMITQMFELLAATGKLIRISELNVSIGKETTSATDADYIAQAEMYQFIVQEYVRLIPATQRYGITLLSAVDRANDPIGLWTIGFNRKRAYASFADGLNNF